MTDVHVADHGAVRTITLDRPQSRNGLTLEVCQALAVAIEGTSARAIVITGANGAFCSGLDLKDAMKRGVRPGPDLAADMRQAFHGVIRGLVGAPCPTIAAVDGAAAGFGCDIALACDLRVVSERAVFGEIFVKRGLMPDGGGTYLLPRIIGLGRALELMFTGDLVGADDALRIGLANKLVHSGEIAGKVAEMAERLAAGPPLALRKIKDAIYAGLEGTFAAALDREVEGQMALLGSRDFAEGVTAFLQKRDPKFQGA